MKILAFGEILFDVIEGENFLGGAPLNFAAHLAKCGAESYIFSKVGQDDLGNSAVNQVKNLGVKTGFVQTDAAYPTGTVEVTLSAGQPEYTIHEDVAYDFIALNGKAAFLESIDFDVLYFGTLAQRSQQSRRALRQIVEAGKFKQVFYDVNLRQEFFSKEILESSLQLCTILKLNDEEVKVLAKLLYGQELSLISFLEKTAETFHINIIIVTAGAAGCFVYEGQQLHTVQGHAVTVADTVGAGDAFSAAFVYKLLSGESASKAAATANKLGAFVASCRGPIPVYSAEIKKELGLQISSC